jgi:hypothetical protein
MPQPPREIFWSATRNDVYWVVWSGAALIALITLSRAASGALAPVAPGWAVLAAGVGIGFKLLTWWWSLPDGAADAARAQIARGSIAVCPPLIIGLILAGASTPALLGVLTVAAGGLMFVVVVSEQVATSPQVRQRDPAPSPAMDLAAPADVPAVAPPPAPFDDPTVNQQIIRRRTDSGHDCLEALLRLEFAVNQREASIHLPIQPAMDGSPQVECEPLDDADLQLKVTAAHPYGVRIEAKRASDLDESATIPVGILIHAATEAEMAA